MAKRFIDTNFFKHPFVRGLEGATKGLYLYIICDCSAAGIWAKDLEIASIFLAQKVTDKHFDDAFVKSWKAIFIGNGKYFFPDFIEFQYPAGLQEKNLAHKNIISELSKYSLIANDLTINIKGALKGLQSPLEGSKVMVKEKVMVMEEEKEMEKEMPPVEILVYPSFDDFWNLYDKKQGREACVKKWRKLSQSEKEKIMFVLPMYVQSTPEKKFRKNPETYINNKSWNDEIIDNSDPRKSYDSANRELEAFRNSSIFGQG